MKRLALALVASVLLAGSAFAHESRPGYLELREAKDGSFESLWKKPARGDLLLAIEPVFPEGCTSTVATQEIVANALFVRKSITCEGGLAGKTIHIAGLQSTLTDVLVRIYYLDGVEETHLLKPASPSVTIGERATATSRAAAYVRLGMEHIGLGIDHLLFVLGLLLIVDDRWMLVKTITSFTIAHSITLAIATLGYASAPMLPLNAAIALSILFLGPEIVRKWRGGTSLTIRHPWIVAFAFGLLHGFGFATGLIAMGLPSGEIPLALFLFNVGVELGQVLFVVLVILLERSFRTLQIVWPRFAKMLPGYAVGSLGAFWTIQRVGVLVGALLK